MTIENTDRKKLKICVVGLGYVGLPLLIGLHKSYECFGYDTSKRRIEQIQCGIDSTGEITDKRLLEQVGTITSTSLSDAKDCNIYIVTVPTPINREKAPDLRPIISATEDIAQVLRKGDMVVYESTVYPGVTEDICGLILEEISGLERNTEYSLGYSPERINPGDKVHTVDKIVKVVSASNEEALSTLENVYCQLTEAGVYLAQSIKVAEMSKVIENAQRDVNIAFANEVSKICNILGIKVNEVLDASNTKWNFLDFKPGLVGGHCIGIDPYYLSHKSKQMGYIPHLIDTARQINDDMPAFYCEQIIRRIISEKIDLLDINILVLGYTFKENCPDTRNSKVKDIIAYFEKYNLNVSYYDPYISESRNSLSSKYNIVICAVAHSEFLSWDQDKISTLLKEQNLVFDIKGGLKHLKSIIDL